MTVKELIETNACIVEAYITLRGDYSGYDYSRFSQGQYIHEFGIGTCASFGKDVDSARAEFGRGKRGSRFAKPYTLINKEINSRAKNQYWNVLTNVFPKNVLELEVTAWSAHEAFWWKRQHDCTGYESACLIRIDCWIPEDHVKELRVESEVKAIEQIDGQMNILDFKEVLP